MLKSPKIAVIGCGYWGKNLIRNFAELGALAAVCDANQDQAIKFAKEYQVPVLKFDEVLQNQSISGVVIAAPAVQHFDLATLSLQAGKHVFVEKPLALKVEEARRLCEVATEQQRILMVGHLLQYHPAFCELNQLLKKGALGKLLYIYSNRLSLGKFRTEEDVLWSFAPHDISVILSLVGRLPESVHATGSCYLHSHIEDVSTVQLHFTNGIKAQIFVSWLHPFKEQKLVVVGDKCMAVINDSLPWEQKLQLYPHQINWGEGSTPTPVKADAQHIPLKESEPLKLECQHFLACITSNQKPLTDEQEGLHVLQVLEAAEKSMKEGIVVQMQEKPLSFDKHETSFVDEGCEIGSGTKIWHFSHVLKGTKIGKDCIIGQNVMIGPDVIIGNRCKVQNNVALYKGITLEDGVFCGPSCVFTNVFNPRAEIERKNEFRKTYVEKGVTIGANATILCGIRLGAYSFVGAGAVVLKDIKPHALVVGNPARQIGWMSHAGEKLGPDLVCPREGRQYCITADNCLKEVLHIENESNVA